MLKLVFLPVVSFKLYIRQELLTPRKSVYILSYLRTRLGKDTFCLIFYFFLLVGLVFELKYEEFLVYMYIVEDCTFYRKYL